MQLTPLSLTDTELITLEAAAHGPHPRLRRRAQAVLGHQWALSINQLPHTPEPYT